LELFSKFPRPRVFDGPELLHESKWPEELQFSRAGRNCTGLCATSPLFHTSLDGNGGHNAEAIKKDEQAPRVPQIIQHAGRGTDQVTFENYDAAPGHFGYLRVVVNAAPLPVEYHPASDGADLKTPDDSVTIDLKTRKIAHFHANDLRFSAAANRVAALRRKH